MDEAAKQLGNISIPAKDYIWEQNENGHMIVYRKKEAMPCSLKGAVTASFKLDKDYFLTQFILQTFLTTALGF